MSGWHRTLLMALPWILLSSCSAPYFKRSADKEAYQIIEAKQKAVFGVTNNFTIDTRYSHRDASEIKAPEILQDRLRGERRVLTLSDALRIAVENNPQYQTRKEQLYIAALTLTRARYNFGPRFFAGSSVAGTRQANEDQRVGVSSDAGLNQTLKTGGRIGLGIANDLIRFYTGDPRRSAISTISASFVQPLLRGAGARVAAESLTQAERDVIYRIREFSHFQNTFALGVVRTYLGLLQLQDTVKNEYSSYTNFVRLRERAEDLAKDRQPQFQADQAKQQELSTRSQYILRVEQYQTNLDQFKVNTLGLPLGYDLRLDESALKEIEALGLIPVPLSETEAYDVALKQRLDLLNEIDRFEDSQRKILVAASALKPDLTFTANASLASEGKTDYAKFDLNNYQATAGLQLDLPLDRLLQRNDYRSSLLSFESQIRTLALFLDNVRNNVRDGLRTVDQARQSFEIQKSARDLADRRVENFDLLLQAGQAEMRDVIDAQLARVSAYNAVTRTLLDYHLTRLQLLVDMGILKTDDDQFWLKDQLKNRASDTAVPAPAASSLAADLIPPDKLFEK